MPSRDYFRNLAQMSRRIAGNMTDPAIVERLLAIGDDYDQQAAIAADIDPAPELSPPKLRPQGTTERN